MKEAVSPKHYKEIVPGFEYMQMMEHMLPDVDSHLLGQVYKYLMRLGKKDKDEQELGKVLWYLVYLMRRKAVDWNDIYDIAEDAAMAADDTARYE